MKCKFFFFFSVVTFRLLRNAVILSVMNWELEIKTQSFLILILNSLFFYLEP